jgi:hypothetical protein
LQVAELIENKKKFPIVPVSIGVAMNADLSLLINVFLLVGPRD